MRNWLLDFPDQQTLLKLYPDTEVLNVNSHVHTPYSFSAFDGIDGIFEMAIREDIASLGINDFFVTDGYEAFHDKALKNRVFPLFNIEFIGLMKEEQQSGVRINDPNNPGRCYFCGKGLDFPFHSDPEITQKLENIIRLSQEQVQAMIDKLNSLFSKLDPGIKFSYQEIKARYAKNLVRERHLAKAVRIAIFEGLPDERSRIEFLIRLFGGKSLIASMQDIPSLENEIRSNLFKSGGSAFVEEDESTFLSIAEITGIILNAGGIPCYPVLLDDKNGNYTEFERSPDHLLTGLSSGNISCIELIPGRNDAARLDAFVKFFHERGFIILMGTEHNTPDLIPLTCNTRGGKPLSDYSKRIAYEGACVVAAHQYHRAVGMQGYIGSDGTPKADTESMIKLGNALIHYQHQFKQVNQ